MAFSLLTLLGVHKNVSKLFLPTLTARCRCERTHAGVFSGGNLMHVHAGNLCACQSTQSTRSANCELLQAKPTVFISTAVASTGNPRSKPSGSPRSCSPRTSSARSNRSSYSRTSWKFTLTTSSVRVHASVRACVRVWVCSTALGKL